MIPGQVLQVLLVGGDADLRESAEKALSGWPGPCALYWVSQLDLALVRAQDVQPRVILLDVSSDGPAGLQLIGQIAARFPQIAQIALVPADAIDRAREVVLAGAGAFLTLPLEPAQLQTSLRQVLSQPASSQRVGGPLPGCGRVIAFIGPKGGAGRTTLAINTAISLLQIQSRPVVLMDADYAAPALDVALNLRSQLAMLTIGDLLPRISRLDADLLEPVLLRHSSGIRLLLAPPPGEMQTLPSPPQVQQVLGWLRRLFPWVVVDVGLPLDEMTFAVLDGADRIVQVAMPEMVGIRNGRLMLDQFRERGYSSEKVWLALNRANLTGGLPLAAIEERLGHTVRHLIPDDQALATETINRGQPFVVAHARSPIARACVDLARDLVRSFAEMTDAVAATGLATPPAPVTQVTPDTSVAELSAASRGLLPIRTGLPRSEAAVPTAALDEFPPLAAATVLEPVDLPQPQPELVDSEATPPVAPEIDTPEPMDIELSSHSAPEIESQQAASLAVPEVQAPERADAEPASSSAPKPEAPGLVAGTAPDFVEAAAVSVDKPAGHTPETASMGSLPVPEPARLAQRPALTLRSRWQAAGLRIPHWSQIIILILAAVGIALLLSIPMGNLRQAANIGIPAQTAAVPAASPASLAGGAGAGATPSASLVPATVTARPGISVPTTSAAVVAAAVSTAPATATALPTETALPTQAPTVTPAPSATPTASATATAAPVPPTQAPAPTPRPATRAIPPTARPKSFGLSVPAYEAPAPNAVLSGNVTFRWLPTGPLPAGAGYEVVWWNPGEDPAAARGMAPVTAITSQVIDIGVLYESHQMTSTSFYWAVLLVQLSPYQRLTQPANSNPQLLTYRP